MLVVHQFSDCSTVLTPVVLVLPCARQAQPLLSIRTAVGLPASKLQVLRDLVGHLVLVTMSRNPCSLLAGTPTAVRIDSSGCACLAACCKQCL